MPSSISNSLVWIFEAFERDPTYIAKRMFGSDAAYIDGLLCLVAADRDEPWNGLLVCTSQERHAALIGEMPALRPHPVLGKWPTWIYLRLAASALSPARFFHLPPNRVVELGTQIEM